MKKLKYIILLFGLVACSDLEEQVYSEISPSNFYQNAAEAEVAIASVYNSFNRTVSLFDFGLASLAVMPSPKMIARVPWRRMWGNYTTNASDAVSLPRVWDPLYQGVFRANTVIAELEGRDFGSETGGETKRKEIIVEAKFLRAYAFFNLVQLFGDVPLPLVPTATVEGAQLPRTSIADVYKQIILDLKDAETGLPSDKRGEVAIGRPIQATAKFLLAKVYLTMAGLPLQDATTMALAKTKLQEVISLEGSPQGYSLLSSYEDAIRVDNNDERIFAIQESQSSADQGTAFGHVWGARNRFNPSLGIGQFHGGYSQAFYDSFDVTDTRRDVTMLYNYVDNQGNALTYGGNQYDPRWGIFQNKYVDFDQSCCDGDPDMIVYRYSDALLMAAEIENSLNGPTATAYGFLGRVRSRALATAAPAGMSKSQFADYIYEERFKELSFEFQEVYDIRRLGKVEEALSQHPENITFQPTNTVYSPNFNLWPLPISEVQSNPNIESNNPGW